MPSQRERSARAWFEEAARAFVEAHQACACCGQPYQVYRRQRGARLEYSCVACDFFASHDAERDLFFAAEGSLPAATTPTLATTV